MVNLTPVGQFLLNTIDAQDVEKDKGKIYELL